MKEIILKNEDFQENLNTLEEYLLFNKNQEEAKFREFRDIVYGAIINRGYTLWETYVKDVFYEYFSLKKQEYYQKNVLIEKYRLNELPGYLFESAIFNNEDESISFKLNKEIVSFTSKNMDVAEISKLFKRIDIDIRNKLDRNTELINAVDLFEVSFENGLSQENKTSQALKRIIQERNLVSHYAHLDTFQNIEILREWIKYYKLLGEIICKIICLEYIQSSNINKKEIGVCKDVVGKNIILIDVAPDIYINLETHLYVYNNETLVDIVMAKSFMVEDKEVEHVSENEKAGLKIETIFAYGQKMKQEYKYYLIENSVWN